MKHGSFAFVVKGRGGQVLYRADAERVGHESIEGLSRRLLNQTTPNYVLVEGAVELMGLKNYNEGNDPSNYKAYGWCFFVDGENYEEAPADLLVDRVSRELLWAFSYSEMKNGQWVSSCTQDK